MPMQTGHLVITEGTPAQATQSPALLTRTAQKEGSPD